MSGGELVNKINNMNDFLDEASIAAALRIPIETVRQILAGDVNIGEAETEKGTIVQIATNPVYRQRVISVWRGRGGAGCTSIALHLAYALEHMMSVLLVDLDAADVGSDVGYYLRQPEYPNMEVLSNSGLLAQAVIQVEPGLSVLLPPMAGAIDKALISRLAIEARQKYDVVILDLPNIDDELVLEAVSCSNALVMVVNGLQQETKRALARKNRAQRDTVLVANGCTCDADTVREYTKLVEIPEDKDLQARMEKGIFYKKGSPLTVGAEKIRDSLFGMRPQEESGFGEIMRRLLGVGGR